MNFISLKKVDLNNKYLEKENNELKVYRGYSHCYTIFNSKVKLSDALDWKDISQENETCVIPISCLIINKGKCVGYVTSLTYGVDGVKIIENLPDLADRKAIAQNLVDLYEKLLNNNSAYTNWCLEDLLVENSQKIRLINPHFLIDVIMHEQFDTPLLDYNFCVLVLSVLYGLDFSIINAEEIPDLNIPEGIKEILNNRKNEKITIDTIKAIIRYTKNEFVYQPQIQKLKREILTNN